MATQRLTCSDRITIRDRALEAAFIEREKVLGANEDRLGRLFYALAVPESERKLAAKMPKTWLTLTRHVQFNANGMKMQFVLSEDIPVPITSKGGEHLHTIGVVTDIDLIAEANKHFCAKIDLKNDRNVAYRTLNQLLGSFSTAKMLLDNWPDGAPFIVGLEGAPTNQLVPIVADVNKMLGLPLKTKKVA